MEAAQARVQNAFTAIFQQLDKDIIRKMQGDMYRCSAKCCDDLNGSMDDVQRCIERCSETLTSSQSFIQNEVQNFQNRLQRCAIDCQDKARDRVSGNTDDTDVRKFRSEMEQCIIKCADMHIDMLPSFNKRIRDSLAKGKFS